MSCKLPWKTKPKSGQYIDPGTGGVVDGPIYPGKTKAVSEMKVEKWLSELAETYGFPEYEEITWVVAFSNIVVQFRDKAGNVFSTQVPIEAVPHFDRELSTYGRVVRPGSDQEPSLPFPSPTPMGSVITKAKKTVVDDVVDLSGSRKYKFNVSEDEIGSREEK